MCQIQPLNGSIIAIPMTFLTEAWFWRGTQSAVFYYLSCAPCSKIAYQRQKRKDAKRAKIERETAGTFQQPLPSGTNPHWNEEINLGPGPPPKRAAKEKGKTGEKRSKSLETRGLESGAGRCSVGTGTTSTDSIEGIAVSQDLGRNSGEDWNRRRYQREDEVLWGRESLETSATGLSSLSRSASGNGYYYYARNPEVNELHPPIVSTQPASKCEIQWMLQPPPRAKIMEGKEPSNRSRSGSGTSGGSSLASRGSSRRGGGENLGKRIGERLVEEKKARGEAPPAATSSAPSDRGGFSQGMVPRSMVTKGQRHDRDEGELTQPCRNILLPSSANQQPLSSLAVTALPEPFAVSHISRPPPLSAVPSTSTFISQPQSPNPTPKVLHPLLISMDRTSSLHDLQKLMPPGNTNGNSTNRGSMPTLEATTAVKLPHPTKQEEDELKPSLSLDSGHASNRVNGAWNFPLPTVNLQAGQRWSMDV